MAQTSTPTLDTPALGTGTGIEVWVESPEDLETLTARLEQVLVATPARLTGIHSTSGSLWPVPVDATTNRVRVRLVVDGDEGDVVDALEQVATVTPWSLVHRLDGKSGKGPPGLH